MTDKTITWKPTLRNVPVSLRGAAKMQALREGKTLEQFLVDAIKAAVNVAVLP